MINDWGRACLIDFGLAHFTGVTVGESTHVDTSEGFSIRWCAPELLQGDAVSTPASDVYSFASTVCEVYTYTISQFPISIKCLLYFL